MSCPACGADRGTVGVTGGHLCPTCLHREGVTAPEVRAKIETALPPKMVQLIAFDTGNAWAPQQLYCLCDDGTAWVLNGERVWIPLPRPELED